MAIPEIREALINYATVKCEDSTRRSYLNWFDQAVRENPSFIERINKPSKQDVMAYLAYMKKRGFKGSVLRTRYFFLKSLCENVMDGEWPVRKQDAPPEPGVFRQPIFEFERIVSMIQKMKKCTDFGARTRFAVATVYGPRRVELMPLSDQSINLEMGTIQIITRKHGDIRTHLIPNEIKPYLSPDSLIPLSEWQLSELFKRIEWFCGYQHEDWFGWHSIRRRLTTYFDDAGVDEGKIYAFMRWKRRKTILHRYIVRKPMETDKKLANVDMDIFKIHPFLQYWADGVTAVPGVR